MTNQDSNINSNITARVRQRFPEDLSLLHAGILKKDILSISRAITLTENKNFQYDSRLLHFFTQLPVFESSLRIAITGPPGAGKSTFIENLGLKLIDLGYSVAVLAIDPASENTKGSILGDKTRMDRLGKSPHAYIRPSSNALEDGGVRTSTYQSIRICEAAEFDFILVETVGVGQSEIKVSKMTDLLFLMLSPTGGDELQGIKKGIVETADRIIVNKCDGQYIEAAKNTLKEYRNAVHLRKKEDRILGGVNVEAVSSLEDSGIQEIATMLASVIKDQKIRKKIQLKREMQSTIWYKIQAMELMTSHLMNNERVKKIIDKLSNEKDLFKALLSLDNEIGAKIKLL